MRVVWVLTAVVSASAQSFSYGGFFGYGFEAYSDVHDCQHVLSEPFGHHESENGNYEGFTRRCWLIKPRDAQTVRPNACLTSRANDQILFPAPHR